MSQGHPFRQESKIASDTPSLASAPDLDALAARWRTLEQRAGGSFFQSWSWVGCLAHLRFPDPMLLAVQRDGQDVALALFNRGRGRLGETTLWLGESGVAALDAVYVEHNGVLLAPGHAGLLGACLREVAQGRRVVLSGVDDAHLLAAMESGALVRVLRSQQAPFIDLAGLAGADGYLAALGSGTRYQLRRSSRRYAARGVLSVHRAATVAEALAVLDDLARLHQASWVARGRPGAFADPAFNRFHTELICRALPRGEVELLRITAGAHLVGCLYNFRHGGDVLAYQSGFDYAGALAHEKPGMTCHHLAIELARAEGMRRYDFLAGESRYKTSLANGSAAMHWLELLPRWSVSGVLARVRMAARI
jgi:CelD/BcsL family acetyltransferase involved in cellulose biosynthesis